ncbi:molybdopterin molybdenumtransferase MoeA [Altererythrobacter marinus]|uniref:Molybdopterin molybdenumtransferase n=1 Tax=Pelagerythrobacter marinus TaxID=538382 RepID=A0ABW9UVT4_9SPHN|nr:molybdopterin molybdotransferase MoeA [Pelagerythrobacter marinus]MXO67700.1 molybdopterin molybdenumtransferase MoeA [Pelagerythrobacter marinus]
MSGPAPSPIPLEEAWARLLESVRPLPAETLPVADALGRHLAAPLTAAATRPAADLSAMDGYALSGPGPWALAGESRCGAPFGGTLSAGQAVRISTGAAMPAGADRVLVQEEALRNGDRLSLAAEPPEAGANVRRRGIDFERGDRLLPAGSRLGARQVALALSAGIARVAVHHAPRVAILDCGDELVDGSVPASNGAMLAAMAAGLPCTVRRIGPVADDAGALGAALAACADCDLVLTSGGASVGDHDLVRPALEAWGARIAFWRVAIRPGKPLLVARREDTLVLGLPGNPVSAFVTGFLFALPALRAMLGAPDPLPRAVPVPAGADLPPGGARGEFTRAVLREGRADPIRQRDSSLLAQLARADALIWHPPHCAGTKGGTDVPVYRLENGAIA